jgi:hypothetical protein
MLLDHELIMEEAGKWDQLNDDSNESDEESDE